MIGLGRNRIIMLVTAPHVSCRVLCFIITLSEENDGAQRSNKFCCLSLNSSDEYQ